MANFKVQTPGYYTPQEKVEFNQMQPDEQYALKLDPWSVQNIVYEMVQNHLLTNSPQSCGFSFTRRYTTTSNSGIKLAIGHDWGNESPGTRPAIFVFRDNVQYSNPIIGQITEVSPKDSKEARLFFRNMTCSLAVIAKTVGFTEMLANYVKIPLVDFQLEIKRAFKFRQFQLTTISAPQPYKEAVNNFIIIIQLATSFDEGTVIQRDDLKLKKVLTIFDHCVGRI